MAFLLTYTFDRRSRLPLDHFPTLPEGMSFGPLPAAVAERDTVILNRHKAYLHPVTLSVEFAESDESCWEDVDYQDADSKAACLILSSSLSNPNFPLPLAVFVTREDRLIESREAIPFGWLGDSKRQDVDFDDVLALYRPIREVLRSSPPSRIVIALRSYQICFQRDVDWALRYSNLMIGMEALFSQGASEISHQVSERAAFFLSSNPAERVTIYENMRAHYANRSTIVHGGNIYGKKLDYADQIRRLSQILACCLRPVLLNERAKAVFLLGESEGQKKKFGRAMKELVFYGGFQTPIGESS